MINNPQNMIPDTFYLTSHYPAKNVPLCKMLQNLLKIQLITITFAAIRNETSLDETDAGRNCQQ